MKEESNDKDKLNNMLELVKDHNYGEVYKIAEGLSSDEKDIILARCDFKSSEFKGINSDINAVAPVIIIIMTILSNFYFQSNNMGSFGRTINSIFLVFLLVGLCILAHFHLNSSTIISSYGTVKYIIERVESRKSKRKTQKKVESV